MTSTSVFQSASVPADESQNTSTAESPNVGGNAIWTHPNSSISIFGRPK